MALARALYRQPFLVVLDEPNSNLDRAGEAALSQAIANVRSRNGIVVLIAHRASALATVNHVMVLSEGRIVDSGPKDEVLQRLGQASQRAGQANKANPASQANKPAQSVQMSTSMKGRL